MGLNHIPDQSLRPTVLVGRKRQKKTLFTNNKDGDPVRICAADTSECEAEFIADGIEALLREGGPRLWFDGWIERHGGA